MALSDIINTVFREFRRYTGDGLPGEPWGAFLPVGDPQSGPYSPKKSELREAFGHFADGVEDAADRAEDAAAVAGGAMSAVVLADNTFSTRTAAQSWHPLAAPDYLRTGGYTAAGDGGGALFKKVGSQPAHAGKLSINLSGGGSPVWYEIAEPVIDVKMFGAKGDGVTDDRGSVQAAVDFLKAKEGGALWFSSGDYKIMPTNAPDTAALGLSNGILLPFISYDAESKFSLLAVGKVRLIAGANNMIVVRRCQPGSVIDGFEIDGGCAVGGSIGQGFTQVWGIGDVAADRTNTTFLASQSFVKTYRNFIHNCSEGHVMEPGNTLPSGEEAGMFYFLSEANDFNFCKRSMWLKSARNHAANRPTRGKILYNRFTRGQVGIDLDYATEIDLIANKFEFMLGATYGTDLYGFGVAIRAGEKSEYNYSLFDFMEQCDRWFAIHPLALPTALQQHGNPQAGVNDNNAFTHKTAPHLINLTRRTSAYEPLSLVAHHSGFARLIFDRTGTNSRDAAIEISGVQRMIWDAGGTKTYGSTHFWRTDADAGLATLTTTRFSPGDDNLKTLGLASERWSAVYAGTGAINTSDARVKDWRGALTAAEISTATELSKLVGVYRWKDAIAAKGDGARLHIGVTVQAVMKVFETNGLDPFAYGMVCYDEWEADDVTGVPNGNRYGLRYDELWGFVAAGFEARLSALEEASVH